MIACAGKYTSDEIDRRSDGAVGQSTNEGPGIKAVIIVDVKLAVTIYRFSRAHVPGFAAALWGLCALSLYCAIIFVESDTRNFERGGQ